MTATRQDIEGWLNYAKSRPDVTHVIIAVDHYAYENYPVYVTKDQNAREEVEKIQFGGNMQGVDECYNLSLDTTEQMSRHRCFEY